MADNVQGFNHLDEVLLHLGDQFRTDAIKRQMLESKMHGAKPGMSTGEAAMARLAYQKEKDMADRLEAGYSATYSAIAKANPHLPPLEVQKMALKQMQLQPNQSMEIGKFYGKTPYNVPSSVIKGFMSTGQPGQSGDSAYGGMTPDEMGD